MESTETGHKTNNPQLFQKISRTKEILASLRRVPLDISQTEYQEAADAFGEFMNKVRRDARLKDALSNASAAQTHVG